MADFRSCIDEHAEKGQIAPDVAARARKTYDDARATADESFGPADADRIAADAVMRQLEIDAVEAKRRRALMVRARTELLAGVDAYKKARGYIDPSKIGPRRTTRGVIDRLLGRDPPAPPGGFVDEGVTPSGYERGAFGRALELIVENRPGLSGAPFPSIEGRYRAIRGKADALMASAIERFETRTGFDTPHRADLANMVREAFGEDTGDKAAKALATAWAETAEHLRLQFNAAGGSIGKLDGWGMPQAHDAYRVRQAGREQWVAYVMPMLDRSKMIDDATGQPLSEGRLMVALGEVWESIASLGANARQPGEHTGQGALSKRRSDSRFLAFKDADAWMAYQSAFGDGDSFSTMMGHIDELSRDIAQMQILGPNPTGQWTWLKQAAQREALLEEAAGIKGASDAVKGYVRTADAMLEHFTGSLSTPINSRIASWGVASRAYLTSVSLGSAILSDIPSAPIFGAVARSFAGLSKTGDMARLAQLLNPADGSARATARRSGFVIESATDGMVRATQDNLRLLSVGERMDGGMNAFARRLPVAVLRAQGMTAWDAARKRSFHFEFMGALHDRRGKTIADLRAGDGEDRAFATWLTARGFTEADWTTIRSAPVWEPAEGAQFLRPTDIPDESLALRMAEAIDIETRLAVPQTTLWTRAKLIGTDRPGTVVGEARRSWAMFRSFTLTATHMLGEEMMLRGQARGLPPFVAGASGAAGALLFLTLAGGISIQLREIAKGNDPKPMTDPRFWAAAAMQGGGLGILGDFFYAAEARNGKSASQVAAFGPVGSAIGDLYGATIGNVVEIAEDVRTGDDLGEAVEGARIGRDVVQLARSYTPGGNIWWARAAYNRAVLDNLQRMLDPEAEEDFARRRKRMERDQGQSSWWPQGEDAPQRGPDMRNAVGAPAG
jgi:hypothetical protein